MGTGGKRLLALLAAIAIAFISLKLLLTAPVRQELHAVLDRARIGYLLAALGVVPAVQYLRAWRFGMFLEQRGGPPDRRLFRIASYLLLFNYLLPMRIGEASFPILVRRTYGTGYVAGLGFLALTRVVDLVAVLAIGGMVGAAVLLDPRLEQLALAGGMAAALLLLLLPFLAGISSRWLPSLEAHAPRVGRLAGKLMGGFHLLGSRPHYVGFLALTTGIWMLQYLVAWLVLAGATDVVSVGRAVVGNSAAILSFALPINGVAGVGPLQAAWAWALGQTGVSWSVGVASGLVLNVVMVVGAVGVAGLAWLWNHAPAFGGTDATDRVGTPDHDAGHA